jgi:hypothetical protein
MVEKIRMNVYETLELEYLVEQINDDTISITGEPTSGSSSIDYIATKKGVFNPSETGIHKLDINGQTVEIEVYYIPDSVDYRWPADENSGSTLSPTIGSVDISLNFSTWLNDSIYNGGTAPDFDGTDDIGTSASTIAINDTQGTITFWTDNIDSDTAARGLWDVSGDDGNPTDGPQAFINGDTEVGYRFFSGGSGSELFSRPTVPDVTSNQLFWAFNFDGDNGEMWVYKSDGTQETNVSGTAVRGQTVDETLTLFAGVADHIGGALDDITVSTSQALTESDIEDILNTTGPNA